MGRQKTGRKSSNEYNYPRKNYIVTLSKDREFIIVRFCCKDYGLLNINLLKNKYVKPYLNEGWEILDIEVYYNKDWADY